MFSAMTEAAWKDKRGESPETCRTDLLQKIYWVKERYECLEREFLSEIDRQVRRYTRASTQKIKNLTNRDRNVRGNLNYLLTALSRNPRAGELAEEMQSADCWNRGTYAAGRNWNCRTTALCHAPVGGGQQFRQRRLLYRGNRRWRERQEGRV